MSANSNLNYPTHRATGNRLRQAVHISVLLEKIRNVMTTNTKNAQAIESAEKLTAKLLEPACAKIKTETADLVELAILLCKILKNAGDDEQYQKACERQTDS